MNTDLRSLRLHALIAVVGLSLAAWAWRDVPQADLQTGDVPFAPCAAAKLRSASLGVGARVVRVDFDEEGGAVISLTRRVAHASSSSATSAGANLPAANLPVEATPTETLRMAADRDRIARLRDRLAPALAKRGLGQVSAARLASLGFGKSATPEVFTLTCATSGAPPSVHEFEVGTTSYGGGGRYLRGRADGKVWLVDPTLISDVRLADSRYVERRLIAQGRADLHRVEVHAQGRRRVLLQRGTGAIRSGASWVDAAAPNEKNELYGNWLNKLLRLRALSWLPPAATAREASRRGDTASAAAQPVGSSPGPPRPGAKQLFWLQLSAEDGQLLDRVELWQGAGPEKKDSPNSRGKPVFWAFSQATGGWVVVSIGLGQQLADDVGAVVGAE